MRLTPEERRFLDAYIHEVTHWPFGGPATEDLRRKGIGYFHLDWILTAYQRELSAEGTPVIGFHNPEPPPSPWETLEQVKQRSQELQRVWEPIVRGQQTVPTH
jgi:hypothetical protein